MSNIVSIVQCSQIYHSDCLINTAIVDQSIRLRRGIISSAHAQILRFCNSLINRRACALINMLHYTLSLVHQPICIVIFFVTDKLKSNGKWRILVKKFILTHGYVWSASTVKIVTVTKTLLSRRKSSLPVNTENVCLCMGQILRLFVSNGQKTEASANFSTVRWPMKIAKSVNV